MTIDITSPRTKAVRPEIVKRITQRNAQMIRNDWLASPMGEYEYEITYTPENEQQLTMDASRRTFRAYRDAYTGRYTFVETTPVASYEEPIETVDSSEWTKRDIAGAIRRTGAELLPRDEKRFTKAALIEIMESVA